MLKGGRQRWIPIFIEIIVGLVLLAVVSLNALRRMDYLGADTMQHIRMTDSSRTAYVAKNIVEGRGYTTNDLPAALVDFYDQKGKLHDEDWVNADRFPFAAYLTALIYAVAGGPSWELGILIYNLVFFIAFLLLLYRTTAWCFADKYAGLFAVTIALLHPYTYFFLYWKDGDALLLTLATMAALAVYFRSTPGETSRVVVVLLGSLLAFVFLARPNFGVPLILVMGGSILRRLWATSREVGVGGALRHHLSRELLIPLVVLAWCVPFMIHSLSEWGQPLFSANNIYQLPLGTRYGMGTDTWWKYTEPGQFPTFSLLVERAGGELLTKFTTSWAATIRHILGSHTLEIVLTVGLFAYYRRRGEGAEAAATRPLRLVAGVIAFAVAMNILMLPLYGYQHYSYRHYLAFGLPLLWIASGRAVSLLGASLRPVARRIADHVSTHWRWWLAALVLALLAWNFGTSSPADEHRLFVRTSRFAGSHTVGAAFLLACVVFHRVLLRPPWFPRLVFACFALVFVFYRPNQYMKRANHAFFALDQRVWDELRERRGLVSSFALQNEVAWNTDRKNIPAPEWPMHIYSFLFDHDLEVEDLYIESGEALLGGIFGTAAPGFEGYERLQTYRWLPGYELAFHSETSRGYAKYRIKPVAKASTVFSLVDKAAVQALRRGPDRIDLGDPRTVIFTPHGWADYLEIDGKKVVAGTNRTRERYRDFDEAPFEDASITFFIDERQPISGVMDVYVPAAGSYVFYWNLDLYAYDRPSDRKSHELATLSASAPGWTRVTFDVPKGLVKRGLNKVGFRASSFAPVVLCPQGFETSACEASYRTEEPFTDKEMRGKAPVVIRPEGQQETAFLAASLFAHALELRY